MPLFPGCAAGDSYTERKSCADRKLVDFIYSRLRWSEATREACCAGIAVISFIVEADGVITGARIVRDPGCGTGAEALRVVRQMRKEGVRWEPGRQHGRAVPVQFNVPVRFRLE